MEEAKTDRKWKRIILIASILLFVVAGLIVLLSIWGINYLMDIFWFDSLGYLSYYFLRLYYRYIVFVAVAIFFFAVFFINFRIAGWFAHRPPSESGGNPTDAGLKRRLTKHLHSGSMLVYGAVSLILGILLALPAFEYWQKFLFFIFGPSAGVQSPYFGLDVSFFLFRYPVFALYQKWLLIASGALLAGTFALYAFDNGFLTRKGRLSKAAKWHLGVLIVVVGFIGIWGSALQLFGLVYDRSNVPVFDGPGYVQMIVTQPLIWLTMILMAALAATLIIVLVSRRGKLILVGLAVALAGVMVLRGTHVIEHTVNEYIVQPNELGKQTPYIAGNIEATLKAYRLNNIEIRDYKHERFPVAVPMERVRDILRNIPVWNEGPLETVFHQLQELRTYYAFPPVSVGRYTVGGRYQQVFLAPRELDYGNLPGSAQNWINRHLTYTHGFGTVMVPASQSGESPMTWFIRGIPPVSDYGLTTAQPRIYYGLQSYHYAIAPNNSGELDYPLGQSNATNTYDGKGGVPIGSLYKKCLYAYYFKDKKILLTTKTNRNSKILYRRNILDRVQRLVPYLRLDATPYAAQTSTGIYWLIDAYTTSKYYPAAAPYLTPTTDFNYIRNSVKIVVDAYNGSVDFYVFDESDPIIQAYRRIYPGLFKDKASMPAELRKHVRYPRDIFNIQMRIYARYHQKAPALFYHQEDLWTFADTVKDGKIIQFQPYYLTVNLMEKGRLDYLLLLPMMPKNRNNLRSLAFAGSDPPNYGKIVIYNFPKGELVYGPEQVDAIINQDPNISQMFTLWDQAGSAVKRGEMIILPLANSVLFIQPVYLISRTSVHIPELQRIIMSEGQVAVMEPSLEEAYTKLRERVEIESGHQLKSFPHASPNNPTTAPNSFFPPGPSAPPNAPASPNTAVPPNAPTSPHAPAPPGPSAPPGSPAPAKPPGASSTHP
jgi:uncharacterized membrane protein (UPF0182 family)